MSIKVLLLIAGMMLVSGFAWLKKHDEAVRWEALAKARADSLEAEQAITDGLRKAVASLDSGYARALKTHKTQTIKMRDSLKVLDGMIDNLGHEIASQLPPESRQLVAQMQQACNQQINLLNLSIASCESLRTRDADRIAQRDNIIRRLTGARDGYKKLYEESKTRVATDGWSVVGKASTGALAVAAALKLLGLW